MDSRRFGAPCRGGEPSGPPHGGTVAAPPPLGKCRGVFETREAGRPLHYTHTATRSASLERNTNKKTTDGPNLCIPHRRRAKRLIAELQAGGARMVVLVTWGVNGCRCCECVTWCGSCVTCPGGATHDTNRTLPFMPPKPARTHFGAGVRRQGAPLPAKCSRGRAALPSTLTYS